MLISVLRAYGVPRTVVVLTCEFAGSAVLLHRGLIALPEIARPGTLLLCCSLILLTAIEVPRVAGEHELLSLRGSRGASIFALLAALTSMVLVLTVVDLAGGDARQGVEALVALATCGTAAALTLGSELKWIGMLGYALVVSVEPGAVRLGSELVPDQNPLAVLVAFAAGALLWCLTWTQRSGQKWLRPLLVRDGGTA
jgi:hypothetical protein